MTRRYILAAFAVTALLMSLFLVMAQKEVAYSEPLTDVQGPPPALPVHLDLEGYLPGAVTAVALREPYAYVGTGLELTVLDVSDESQPHKLSHVRLSAGITSVELAGDYAYVTTLAPEFLVIDISVPSAPRLIGSMSLPGIVSHIEVSDGRAYLAASGAGLRIVDLSDPTRPRELGSYVIPDVGVSDMEIVGHYAYIVTFKSLRLLDVTEPSTPAMLWRYDAEEGFFLGGFAEVEVSGDELYVLRTDACRIACSSQLYHFDISNPGDPAYVESFGSFHAGARLVVDGGYAYVLAQALHVVDLPTQTTVRTLPLEVSLGSTLAVSDGYVYIAGGDAGLQIANLNHAEDPWVGEYRTLRAQDVVVRENYAYVSDYGAGLHVVDVTSPSLPLVIGKLPVWAWGNGLDVEGRYAYLAGGDGGLQVVDVMTPSAPMMVGYSDVVTASHVEVEGDYAYVPAFEGGLWILDVTDPTSPTVISHIDTPGSARHAEVSGDFVYVADGTGGLRVVDVSNPEAPHEVGSYVPSQNPGNSYTSEVVVIGDVAYIAGGGTLYTLDISTPSTPRELGYFATEQSLHAIAVDGVRAYLPTYEGLLVVDVASPVDLRLVGIYQTVPQATGRVAIDGENVYVAGGRDGLFILESTTLSHQVWLPGVVRQQMDGQR